MNLILTYLAHDPEASLRRSSPRYRDTEASVTHLIGKAPLREPTLVSAEVTVALIVVGVEAAATAAHLVISTPIVASAAVGTAEAHVYAIIAAQIGATNDLALAFDTDIRLVRDAIDDGADIATGATVGNVA